MIFSRSKILSEIKAGNISIHPFVEKNLQVADYNLTLELFSPVTLKKCDFVTVKTAEKITLSSGVACFVVTRGSAAIKGLDAVQSSIFCEPGTNNQITLEITNSSDVPVVLSKGMSIAKAIFIGVM